MQSRKIRGERMNHFSTPNKGIATPGSSDVKSPGTKGRSLLEFPDRFIVIDLETTGLSPTNNEIIEIAAIKYDCGIEIGTFCQLVKPDHAVNSIITKITGITDAMLRNAPKIKTILPDLLKFIGDDILVAHNANFDMSFLSDKFRCHIGHEFNNDFVDTLRISRKAYPEFPKHGLAYLCNMIPLENTNSHRALADCIATYELFTKCRARIVDTI